MAVYSKNKLSQIKKGSIRNKGKTEDDAVDRLNSSKGDPKRGAGGKVIQFPKITENEQNKVAASLPERNDPLAEAVYQMLFTIKGITPPVWRRVLIPRAITFHKLHRIIQAVYNWQDYHLYRFEFNDLVVCIPDPDYTPEELYGGKVKEINAKRVKIDKLLGKRHKCVYVYDFGDNWEHEVVLEKVLPLKTAFLHPICVDGARYRPPEDVGGIEGYRDFLEIIKDAKHPEYDEYLTWAEKDTGGRKFDPEYFYIPEVNRALEKIRQYYHI